MSLLFSNYDRTWMCNHSGMLTPIKEGKRTCIRCGVRVDVTKPTGSFTSPDGDSPAPARKTSPLGS